MGILGDMFGVDFGESNPEVLALLTCVGIDQIDIPPTQNRNS